MKPLVKIIFSLGLAFFIANSRGDKNSSSLELSKKYFMGESGITLDCLPLLHSTCYWTTDKGRTYRIGELPQDVKQNGSDSCTITFLQPAQYIHQIWTCLSETDTTEISKYQILTGVRPTAPTFSNDGGFLNLEDNVDWAETINLTCSTLLEGIPAPNYTIEITGLQNTTKPTNNTVILMPTVAETKVKLTCTIEQQFLRTPLSTTITLQLEDKPKILGEPTVEYDAATKKKVFKYTFVSNPRIIESDWTFGNVSTNSSVRTSVDAVERYVSSEHFPEEEGESLSLVINNFNDTDKMRLFYLKLVNKKGAVEFGPLNCAGLSLDDPSRVTEAVGICIGILLLTLISVLSAYFFYRRRVSRSSKFLMVNYEDGVIERSSF